MLSSACTRSAALIVTASPTTFHHSHAEGAGAPPVFARLRFRGAPAPSPAHRLARYTGSAA
jgi:hypothetical protein